MELIGTKISDSDDVATLQTIESRRTIERQVCVSISQTRQIPHSLSAETIGSGDNKGEGENPKGGHRSF